jgi:hypothetical protein
MKVYAPPTKKGRTVAVDDVHHRSADQPTKDRKASARALKRSARQHGKKSANTDE